MNTQIHCQCPVNAEGMQERLQENMLYDIHIDDNNANTFSKRSRLTSGETVRSSTSIRYGDGIFSEQCSTNILREANELSSSNSTTPRIPKRNHLYPYHNTPVQELIYPDFLPEWNCPVDSSKILFLIQFYVQTRLLLQELER